MGGRYLILSKPTSADCSLVRETGRKEEEEEAVPPMMKAGRDYDPFSHPPFRFVAINSRGNTCSFCLNSPREENS